MKAKKSLLFTYLTFSLISSLGYGADVQKHMYFLGGGGDPEGDTTIFDNDLKLFGSYLNSSDWNTTVSFNGGHKKTEEIISTKLKKAKNVGRFSEGQYYALISEMINKIQNGELKSGDQLMVSIDTHGARASNEKTHSIAVSGGGATDLSSLAGANIVNLDTLQKLVDVANLKGVKLAIVDMSCFSGNTLNLKGSNTCIISASGPNHYGYSGTVDLGLFRMTNTFSGKFYDLMKKGRNLEEIFLSARTRGDAPDFPLISTPENAEVEGMLYKLMTPYLNYNKNTIHDFDSSYEVDPGKFENQVCKLNQDHESLLGVLKKFENLSQVSDEMNKNEFSKLKSALEEYRSYQKEYEASIRGRIDTGEEIKNILRRDYASEKDIWKDYGPTTFITMDFDKSIKRMQELADKEQGQWAKQFWQESADKMKRQKAVAEEVKNKLGAASLEKIAAYKKAFENSGKSYTYASRVASEAKKVYDTLYKSLQKKENSNPCRDFVL